MAKRDKIYSTALFPELAREFAKHPEYVGNLRGYFRVVVTKRQEAKETWFLVFRGSNAPVVISKQQPSQTTTAGLPEISVQIEDADLLKMITGGMSGIKAVTQKKLIVKGDLRLAQQVEEVFVRAGGVNKAMAFIKQNSRSKL